jgi:hypothetical protein
MTIKPQKVGESLEGRVNVEPEENVAEEIIDSLPKEEEDTVKEIEVTEEPVEGLLGSSTFSSNTHVAPQVLEEAHVFLNRYGIKTDHLTPKEVMAKIEKIHVAKEENAQVLSRGRALDGIERLLTFVPDGYIGEFKRENDMDINRAEALGFKVFISDEAKLASSTGAADGRVKFGDQILMIIPEELHVANRLIKAERLAERRKSHNFQGGAQIDQAGADPLYPLIKL